MWRRTALWMLPREWRATVARDLGDEAERLNKGEWWIGAQAVATGVGLRRVVNGDVVMTDLRYAFRSLVRAPWFTAGAVITFALGIGVNVAVFSAVDRMLFRPLPYADAGRLVVMGHTPPGESSQFYGVISKAIALGARDLPAISGMATSTWNADRYRLDPNPDDAAYLSFVPSSYSMLSVLGVRPILGHDFTIEDARSQAHKVLLSEGAWRSQFGGRADVIGLRLWSRTAGVTAEVVGVLPADFIPPQISLPTLTWSGISVSDDSLETAGPRSAVTPPVLRLATGATLSSAQAQVDTMVAGIRAAAPPRTAGPPEPPARLVPLRQALFGRYSTYVGLIFAAATMVLLVGCANLAALLLVRSRSREHRAAIQLALGASRARVLRVAVIEALALSLAGSTLAVAVLKLADVVISAWLPPLFSKYAAPVLGGRVFAFSIALAAASALVAGTLPGWRSSRVDVMSVLARGGRGGTARLRGSNAVLAVEIAISLLLVACAAFAGRSLVGLLRTDLGYEPKNLWAVGAFLPPSPDPQVMRRQYGDMLGALRSIPGISHATGADVLPLSGAVAFPMGPGMRPEQGQRWGVTDDYVETLGIRVIAGRSISADEVSAGAPVGVFSELGLHRIWPEISAAQAIGRTLQFPGEPARRIIGIVSDVRSSYARPPYPSLYVPLGSDRFRFMDYAVRVAPGYQLKSSDVTHFLTDRGFDVRPVSVSPVTEGLANGLTDQRFRSQLFTSFAVVALLLAAIGLYAVQSFNVVLREREFAVRMSLGADARDLWQMLLRQTMAPVAIGSVGGILMSVWAAQFLQSFLVGVDARDPWTLGLVALVLVATALIAVLMPARRAARTDPATALRAD